METKHTPGPWTTARDNHITLGIPGFGDREDMRIVSGDAQGIEQDVAYVRAVDDDNGNANAALIAAAPEMFEALGASAMEAHILRGVLSRIASGEIPNARKVARWALEEEPSRREAAQAALSKASVTP